MMHDADYEIRLARQGDDHEIRLFLARTPMPGGIRLSVSYDPCIFEALQVCGDESFVMIGVERRSEKVIALGVYNRKYCFVSGDKVRVGYLNLLRIDPKYRNSMLLYKGFKFLKSLCEENPSDVYLTTIIDDNDNARGVLTSRKAGMPSYTIVDAINTYLLTPRALRAIHATSQDHYCQAGKSDFEEIISFIESEGRKRQLFPCYSGSHIQRDEGLLRNLSLDNIYLYRPASQIEGLIGLWDQRPFKQYFVNGYSIGFTMLRWLYNSWAFMRNIPRLPRSGYEIDYNVIGPVLFRKEQNSKFLGLLKYAVTQFTNDVGNPNIMVGLLGKDRLNSQMRDISSFLYRSSLYEVSWEKKCRVNHVLEGDLYLELGAL